MRKKSSTKSSNNGAPNKKSRKSRRKESGPPSSHTKAAPSANKKARVREIIFASVLVGIALAAGGLFYWDINRQIEHTGGEAIGKVTYIFEGAQRKYDNRSVWETLDPSMILYNLDSVRTPEGAEAQLLLDDGTELSLAENTLVILDWSGRTNKTLELVGGNLSAIKADKGTADKATTLSIKSQDAVIEVGTGDVSLSRKEGEKLGITVNAGEASLNIGGNKRTLEENMSALVDEETGDTVIEEASIILKSPRNNRFYVTSQETYLTEFFWETENEFDTEVLEITTNQSFREITFNKTGTGFAQVPLPEGTYYWRVRGRKNGKNWVSPSRKVVMIQDVETTPLSPDNRDDFTFRSLTPEIRFVWQTSKEAEYTLLEIAQDDTFFEPIVKEQFRDSFYINGSLEAGTYYWRVRPYYSIGGLGLGDEKEIRTFTVTQSDAVAPPELTFPSANVAMTELDLEEGLRFSWKINKEIDKYNIRISRNQNLSGALANSETRRNSYFLTSPLTPGDYFWQIKGLDFDGSDLTESEVRKFTVRQVSTDIALERPTNKEFFQIAAYTPVKFTWKSLVKGTYRIRVWKDSMSAPAIFDSQLSSLSTQFPIPGSGRYYWNVALLDDDKNERSRSADYSFLVDEPLASPVVTAPSANEAVSLVGETSMDLAWRPVSGASFYSLKVFRKDSPGLILDEIVTGSSYSIKDIGTTLQPGTYEIDLQAHKKIDDSLTSSSAKTFTPFSISEVVIYNAAEPKAPAGGTSLSRLTIQESGLTFSWEQEPMLRNFTIQLSNTADFARIAQSYTTRGTSSYRINDLATGSYYWRILSSDISGKEAPVSSVSRLMVTDIPALAAPVLEEPSPASINKAKTDTAFFDWTTVEKSQYYQINLTNDETGEALITQSTPLSEYLYPSLAVIPEGSYTLTLQAFRNDRNGKVWQQSTLVSETVDIYTSSMSSPVFTFPESGEKVDLGEKDILDFSWEPLEDANYYEFAFENRTTGEVLYQDAKRSGTSISYEALSSLEPGPYRVSLSGVRTWPDGAVRQKSYQSREDFSLFVSDLEAPLLVFPEPDAPFDMETADRIDFSWTPSEGADYYQFAFFNANDPDLELMSLDRYTKESYIFNRLELLDVGDFFVEIQAFRLWPNGQVRQESPAARYNFTITLPEYDGDVEIISSDKQYTH